MIFIASFLIYLGLEIMPGDPVSFIAGPEMIAELDPARLNLLREELGLNDPFLIRYFTWLTEVIRGNFGFSLISGVPIRKIVFETLPATLELSLAALVFSSFLGVILGILSALNKGSIGDNFVTVAGLLGMSIPRFFLGIVSLLLFSIKFDWFPIGGRIEPGMMSVWDRINHLILPAAVLGVYLTAGVLRYARSSMLDVINKDFIRTARSKGLPEWRVNFLHGFRVAMMPVLVLVGMRLPVLIGGTVVIERVFQWPGIGNTFVIAVRGQNYPLVMMISLFMIFATMLSSLLIDIATAMLDPRVRL